MSKLSNREKIERAIAKKPMTAAQLRAKFPEVKNIYATLSNLVKDGYNVDKTKDGGRKVYSL